MFKLIVWMAIGFLTGPLITILEFRPRKWHKNEIGLFLGTLAIAPGLALILAWEKATGRLQIVDGALALMVCIWAVIYWVMLVAGILYFLRPLL